MWEIAYSQNFKFTINEEELKEAMECWNEDKIYYCKRLERFFSKRFLTIGKEALDISDRRIL